MSLGDDRGGRNLFAAVRMAGHILAGPLLRRRRTSWGATPAETSSTWTGDELFPDPSWTVTHAVTVDAPAERVWPWLAQLDQGRGGFTASNASRTSSAAGCATPTESCPSTRISRPSPRSVSPRRPRWP
ncbi:hypothetical protein [Kocuria sp. CPCC 205263]|uniref:hypothetical protein n=1 Tax=Kocuria sp. CPCC 205263 TaxID=3073555 RepID=UPI0034D79C69